MPKIVKRTGANGFPGWEGMQRDGDPSSIGENKFWLLENVRRSAGNLTERGGQTRLNSSTLAGGELINGIYDSAYGGAGVGGWGGGGGGGVTTGGGSIPAPTGSCPAPQPTTGDGIKLYCLRSMRPTALGPPYAFGMAFYDDEKYPSDTGGGIPDHVFPIPHPASGDLMYDLNIPDANCVYNGRIYTFMPAVFSSSSITGTVRVGSMPPCFGDVRTPPTMAFDVTLPGVTFSAVANGTLVYGGYLYFTLNAFANGESAQPRVYKWDGTAVSEYFTPTLAGIPAGAVFLSTCTSFGGHVWAGFSNSHVAANTYYPQRIINELGTNVTIGAVNFGLGKGFTSATSPHYYFPQTMVEYKGKLYLGGQRQTPEGPAIYSYDAGGTVAVARDLSGVGPTPAGQWTSSGVYLMFVWNGYLWFLYNTRFGSNDAFKIGKFDGTTWTNDVSATGFTGADRMVSYKNKAVLVGNATGAVSSTDGVTWSAFAAAPGGGNPNSCPTTKIEVVAAVL